MNPEYKKLEIEPFNIWARNIIGKVIKLENIKETKKIVDEVINSKKEYKKNINEMVNEYVYNLGNSAEVGGKYIIQTIQNKIKGKKGGK